jgi:Avidin family
MSPKLVAASIVALAFASTLSDTKAQTIPDWSVWKNQRTSLLIVSKVESDGGFVGTFINNAPGYRCRGVPATISGVATGTNVMFIANFAPCSNTITVWKGTLSTNTLDTTWVLHYVDPQGNFQELTDKDTFTKLP